MVLLARLESEPGQPSRGYTPAIRDHPLTDCSRATGTAGATLVRFPAIFVMTRLELLTEPPTAELVPIARELFVSPVIAGLLWQRGLRDPDEARNWLAAGIEHIGDPFDFHDMEAACDRIRRAIRDRERILIHGDYDVDGLTGTVLLVSFLKMLGADVDSFIPDRTDGYSFSAASLAKIREGGFKVCISVDNGTAAIDEVREIQDSGCDVIITDHHHTGPDCADAYATLNPRLDDSGYPFPHLAGCAVAFKLAWGLAASFSPSRAVSKDLEEFLVDAASLVALGSVADVVPLVGENRSLVRLGLEALRHSKLPGIRALIDVLGPGNAKLSAEDISFRLGPRLNAAGRMGNASLAVELLCSRSYGEARALAAEIEKLNRQRQKVEGETTKAALAQVAADPRLSDRRVLVAAGEDWHIGVVGIVAARLADVHRRPAIVLSLQGETARGSGRSMHGCNLKALVDASNHRLTRYGGHAAAIGLELPRGDLEAFREEFDRVANEMLPPYVEPPVVAEARVSLAHWTTAEIRKLGELRPFGAGNRAPRFLASDVRIASGMRRVGPAARGLTLTVIQDGVQLRALAPALGARIEEFTRRGPWHVVYTPRLSRRSDASPIELLVHAIADVNSTEITMRQATSERAT